MVRTAADRRAPEPGDAPPDRPTGDSEEENAHLPAQQHLHELWQVLGLDDEDDDKPSQSQYVSG